MSSPAPRIPEFSTGEPDPTPLELFARSLKSAIRLPGLEDIPTEPKALTDEHRQRLFSYHRQQEEVKIRRAEIQREVGPILDEMRQTIEQQRAEIAELRAKQNPERPS